MQSTFKHLFEFAVEQLKEANIEGHREESLLLLSKMMAIDQSYIIARMEEEVPDEFDINQYEHLVKRRALSERFAYLSPYQMQLWHKLHQHLPLEIYLDYLL